MFDGVPDQLHQFIASRNTSLPLHLSFPPLHGSSTNTFPSFDPYTTTSQQVPLQRTTFLHPLHQQSTTQKNEEKGENNLVAMNLEIERERSIQESIDPWSNDEVLALLRIRSSMENWFPEFTWEHVSRKLVELGFKRSAEKCKEKFEEESRYFNNINYNKNYRIFSELEEVYHGENPQVAAEKNKKMDKPSEEADKMGQNLEEDSRNDQTVKKQCEDGEKVANKSNRNKKKKRDKSFEMFKGFCEGIVHKMMAQQEEMHNKLLEDMVKRDEEKLAREEAWKKQEMDKLNKELETRTHEQAIAGDRQTTIIKFLKKFTSTSFENQFFGGRNAEDLVKVLNSLNPPTSSSLIVAQNSSLPCDVNNQNNVEVLGHQNSGSCPSQINPVRPTSLTENLAPQNPSSTLASKVPTSSALALTPQNSNSLNTQKNLSTPTSFPIQKSHQNPTSNDKEDLGKRWPRDEVLALINIRSNLYSNGEDKEGTAKAPLWERISQGMSELGYKRSAKRCKEKWENINKYFRKTKDVNKKRSLDSRTCPYFHQLSTLYNQGTLVAAIEGPEKRSAVLENQSSMPETHHSSSQGGSNDSTMHVDVAEGEKHMVQAPAFDFEF